jgi:hypothetical protein
MVAEHAHRATALTMEFIALWATVRHAKGTVPVLPKLDKNFVRTLTTFVVNNQKSTTQAFVDHSAELDDVRESFMATLPGGGADMPVAPIQFIGLHNSIASQFHRAVVSLTGVCCCQWCGVRSGE